MALQVLTDELNVFTRDEWTTAPITAGPRSQPIRNIIIHHTAGASAVRGRDHFFSLTEGVRAFHVRGEWVDIAYNLIADHQSNMTIARGLSRMNGANAPRNADSASLCFHGNYDHDEMTDAMKIAILELAEWTQAELRTCPGECLAIHRDVSPTSCPGKNIVDWFRAGMPDPRTGPEPEPEPEPVPCELRAVA